ncbi:phosphotransferase family protein [Nocardia sp. NPDC050697]|uniref:phosphotransferase family protein n=1 Tax=Nocardia sp. NPDC050697 TaxID=3155158 RepID=UPI0033D4EB16
MNSSAIDRAAVTAWLDRLGIARTGAITLSRIGFGQSNLTFLVRDESERRWILRRPPLGTLLESAHDVAREAGILRALEPTDVPVPRVLGVAEPGAVTDSTAVLMEFVPGVVIDEPAVLEAMGPERRRALAASMMAVLARVHAVDLERTGLTGLAGHGPYAQRQLKRWTRQWRESWSGDNAPFDAVTERLAASVPERQELRLVHGDFHLRNVITAPDDGTVVAALDWELSTLGDPLADVGYALAFWPDPELPTFGLGLPPLPGMPGRAGLAELYLDATGRDRTALRFWYVLGIWKIAAIYAGIIRRVEAEPANLAEGAAPRAAEVLALLDAARQAADNPPF